MELLPAPALGILIWVLSRAANDTLVFTIIIVGAFSMIVKTNGSFAALLRMLIWVLRLKGLHFS